MDFKFILSIFYLDIELKDAQYNKLHCLFLDKVIAGADNFPLKKHTLSQYLAYLVVYSNWNQFYNYKADRRYWPSSQCVRLQSQLLFRLRIIFVLASRLGKNNVMVYGSASLSSLQIYDTLWDCDSHKISSCKNVENRSKSFSSFSLP
jgi:hypothetical protein